MIRPLGLHILILGMIGLLVVSGSPALGAGSISGAGFTPGSGTANSIYRFRIGYRDSLGELPKSLTLTIANDASNESTTIDLTAYVLAWDRHYRNGSNLLVGVEFYVYLSGGVDMKNQSAMYMEPSIGNMGFLSGGVAGQNGTFLPEPRVFYVPCLRARSDGKANGDIWYWWRAVYPPATIGAVDTIQYNPDPASRAPTIYDTSNSSSPFFDAYAGYTTGTDWMYAFPDGWPFYHYVDPLNVSNRTFASSEDPTTFPDEGSSTNTYTFNVIYESESGLPAKPWMLHGSDSWISPATPSHTWESGVMLYLRNLDYANLSATNTVWDGRMYVPEREYWKYFHGHHMFKADFESGETPCHYLLRVGPTGGGIIRTGSVDHWMTTWANTLSTNRYYEALPPGRYEYYFAGSDDDYSAFTSDSLKNSVWPQLEETPPTPTAPPPLDYLFYAGDGLDFKRQSPLTWQPTHIYARGDYVIPTTPNGHQYCCSTAGISGATEPGWPTVMGGGVWDGSTRWQEVGLNPNPVWTPSAVHALGDFVVPTVQNGHKYVCLRAGTSSSSEPSWPLLVTREDLVRSTFGRMIWDGAVIWADVGSERPGSYVDKQTYMPGAWCSDYPYDSWVGRYNTTATNLNDQTIRYQAFTFPVVNPGLFQVGSGYPIGGQKFLGTLSPFKRAVDPSIPNQDVAHMRLWAESSGGTIQDVYTFRVNYWQSAGIAASYVRLFVKNGWNADDTIANPGLWRAYPMTPSPGQGVTGYEHSNPLYKTGVTYEVRLSLQELGRGSHCYYFEAADQQWTDVRYGRSATVSPHVCRYPRRPDSTAYYNNIFYEPVLPAKSPVADTGLLFLPVENDIINGPWINTKAELVANSWSVTPTSGPSGANYRFRITYKDADNQRPYTGNSTTVPTTNVIIETDDAGTTYTGTMIKATPSLSDPSIPADNFTRAYSDGVVYDWNSSSAPGLRMQVGERHFKFAFTDNWGSPVEINDNIAGETVYAPENGTSWAGQFIITTNSPPRLSSGNVKSADGTSNEATLWNYTVTYSDADNQSPNYILVFIGRQDSPPNGPIVWDSGHAMEQVNVLDTVYNHGVQFYYSTRLPGDATTPKKYYHCYVASDGIDVADYNATTSASSGMIWRTVESLGTLTTNPQLFSFAHHPIVSGVPATSEYLSSTNYTAPVLYHGTTLLISGVNYALNPLAGTVNVTATPADPLSQVTARYWFGTEPAPSGPGAVGGNNGPVLLDGQVAPAKGESTTNFTYTVTYKDLDGQAPQFIDVVIDGHSHPMTNATGNTTYKEGVGYTYSTTLVSGDHSFYFEASDGSALALFDADPSTIEINPIEGPYINDHPMFLQPTISPSGSVSTGQAVTYSITYRDLDNEGPNSGYPIVYVDNPNEEDWNGTAGAVGDDFIKSNNPLENWTPDQFAGIPVQFTLAGTSQRIAYKILSNTTDTLKLVATDVSGVVTVGSEFTIGKLLMGKQDQTDQVFSDPGGVIYEAKVPSLGVGTHKAHFKAVTTEVTMPGETTDYTLRSPAPTGDMTGPVVNKVAPDDNVAPTLTNGGSTPETGTAATPFRFAVTYTDGNGESPSPHGGEVGYINLVIEETPGVWKTYALSTNDPAPSYSLGVEFAYTLSLSIVGAHQYYFEASDGWVSVRLPSSGYYTAYISRPPKLSQGMVTPTTGNDGRVYEYKVKYSDPDNNEPSSLKLYIDSRPAIEVSIPRIPGTDYVNGVVYTYPLSRDPVTGITLDYSTSHQFYFEATDGYGRAWYDKDVDDASMGRLEQGAPDVFADGCTSTDVGACTLKVAKPLTSAGGSITFTVTGKNQAGVDGRTWRATFTKPADYVAGTEKTLVPTIGGDTIADVTGISANAWTGGKVYVKTLTPVKNSNNSTPPAPIVPINGPFVHENHDPQLIGGKVSPEQGYDINSYVYQVMYKDYPDSDEPEFVEVYIDGSDPSNAHIMQPVGTSTNYAAGVWYQFTMSSMTSGGSHSYFFKASDWKKEVTTPLVTGKPEVHSRKAATISLTVPSGTTTSPKIGEEVKASGRITAEDLAGNTVPLKVDLNLARTDPAGAVTSVTVQSDANGNYQYSWTPKITGLWSVQASWSGNTIYLGSSSPVRTFTATGLSTSVNGLDMISVPLACVSIFPEGVFGSNPPFALAKWLPAKKEYKLYSLLPGIPTDWDFPAIATGQAYWIKTLVQKPIEPAGSVIDDSQPFNIPLSAGWNQIGCPFNSVVEWGDLLVRYAVNGVTSNHTLDEAAAAGWVKNYAWAYNKSSGNYDVVKANTGIHTLVPWKGYWLKVNANCTLVIPGVQSASALSTSSLERAVSSIPDSTVKWQVKMTAQNGERKDEWNYFGASNAGNDRMESPGCFENFVDLYFTGDKGGMYATDLRGDLSTGDSWKFDVDTDREGEIVLGWDSLESVPSNARLVLVDLAENKSVEMTPEGSYRFRTDAGGMRRTFRIDYLSK